jgi:hypothetical protein
MIFVDIPFKDKNNGQSLIIICRGGHHPYHQLNSMNDRFDIIEEKWVLKKWQKDVQFLAPEWTAEIVVMYGNQKAKFRCEGRDVWFSGKQPLQRMLHRKGDRAVKK